MKKSILLFLSTLLLFNISFAQEKVKTYNLNFEILENDKAKDWNAFGQGEYIITFDKNVAQNGNNSASIASINDSGEFKALGLYIPVNFGGKKIKLTGYLKTENVAGGWAGLWMRIDPEVGFDNMQKRGVKGTTDWTKYEIELDLNNQAKTIVIGGLLVGTGKMWIDNFTVTVDGKPLEKALPKELSIAEKDSEFDTGSNIIIPELTQELIVNLDLLGRVWGFLKYYHPKIGKGNYNWDYELFRILPKYTNAKTYVDRDLILLNWINNLGGIKKCKSCKETPQDAVLKPDLAWIDNDEISTVLKEKLQYIQQNRHQGNHYYIGLVSGVKNPEFKNEKPYSDMTYPDVGFRLLSLFKYWNMIQYFFPNRHLMDKDWNTTLKEYIPKIINAKDELAYEKTMVKIIGDIKDTHANLWGGNDEFQKEKGNYYAPVHVRFVEDQLVIVDYYDPDMKTSVGLDIGDIITHINSKSIKGIVSDVQEFYPASNHPTRLRDISFDILRSQDSTSIVTVKRDGKSFKKTLYLKNQDKVKGYYRWYRRDSDGKSFKMLDNNIGYITLKNIKSDDVAIIRKQFKDTKGIIVDIRNYPSEFVTFLLGSYFTSKFAPFVKFTHGNINNPGEFSFKKDLSIPPKGKFYKGNVVVLVNEISQSQAEYTAMAFRAGENVTIVGSTTAGADGNVSSILLPGGLRTMISGIGVYYPDGTETQRIGIVPDIEILPTIQGIKEGRDEPLEKAIEIINKE